MTESTSSASTKPESGETSVSSPTLPTTREPDNHTKRGGPGRLHLLAKTVLAAWEQKPDAWYAEFNEWREDIIGDRPKEEGGKRGFENWNLVSLGMLLAWGYFAAELQAEMEAEPTAPPLSAPEQLDLPFTSPEEFVK